MSVQLDLVLGICKYCFKYVEMKYETPLVTMNLSGGLLVMSPYKDVC